MASKDKTVDAKALLASIAKGWKLVNTPKVRSGFKAGEQKLVQSKDGKTLGMLTLREKGGRDILRKAHKSRHIEYDAETGMVQLSPKGVEYVEAELLPQLP